MELDLNIRPTSNTSTYFKEVLIHLTVISALIVAAFGPQDASWYPYADNLVTMINFVAFVLAIVMVFVAINIEDALKEKPPKKLLSKAYTVYWMRSCYAIIILTCILSGWFFSAVVWSIMLGAAIDIDGDIRDAYKANQESNDE